MSKVSYFEEGETKIQSAKENRRNAQVMPAEYNKAQQRRRGLSAGRASIALGGSKGDPGRMEETPFSSPRATLGSGPSPILSR